MGQTALCSLREQELGKEDWEPPVWDYVEGIEMLVP